VHGVAEKKGSINPELLNERFSLQTRQSAAIRMGEAVGNRSVQRLISNSQQPGQNTIQRVSFGRRVKNWFKKLFGTDPEGAVREMDTWLERASKITNVASNKIQDEKIKARLEQLSGTLGGLKDNTSKVVKVLDVRAKVKKAWAFVIALQEVPDDIAKDPKKAAKAFGKVFSAAGELGDLLPKGPWTPYFEWLKKSGNFFIDMLYGLDPSLRGTARRLAEQAKREGGQYQAPLLPP
ncbi:MAG: hypothetical protein MUO76_20030, partial [Anaerolineaceae bacterium]|nr:hypothetical protein [Anaerolineaceae bacterium]